MCSKHGRPIWISEIHVEHWFIIKFCRKMKTIFGCSRTEATEMDLIFSSVLTSSLVVTCGALLYHTQVNDIFYRKLYVQLCTASSVMEDYFRTFLTWADFVSFCFNDWSKVWRPALPSKMKILHWKFVSNLLLSIATNDFRAELVKIENITRAFLFIIKKSLTTGLLWMRLRRYGLVDIWSRHLIGDPEWSYYFEIWIKSKSLMIFSKRWWALNQGLLYMVIVPHDHLVSFSTPLFLIFRKDGLFLTPCTILLSHYLPLDLAIS